ncbi:flagellin [Agrobacterium sp. SHOUNA12C]|uniref:Flagellin n=3 Tax=Rhizobium rhizogenes TaxID=359 RepID=B9J976_RHIR8|nr:MULTISPECIES: flagellin [Rhizobium]ACM25478.1 flagellin C protein [Rhizobium rhizogenes K84]KAA6486788.1 flagellin [Agrobacterium sp. ICMP 7243]MCJ9722399.1 flagellin [Agrobacterium sp. BETTINA12B]MCJ9757568.1 flagellin [Agrobacterium sp. SHOUNA12C]OCI98098.1 flagellin [Agrobacterium sp. 13-626]OCJ21823.1 flagellin [Agrobacterium sp. B131/95]
MTSILTNNAATAALQTLRGINSNLESTQNAVSSGLRISKASDNAAYWSIATSMKSDDSAIGAVSDALGLGAAKVDTATTAVTSALDIVSQIKSKLVTAMEDSVDKSSVQEEIGQLQAQLKSVAQSASFNGENWVMAASGDSASVVSSFIRGTNGTVSVSTTSYAFDSGATGNVLFGANSGTIDTASGILGTVTGSYSVFSLDITGMTGGQISSALDMVQTALNSMTSMGSRLGSISTRIDLQTSFASSLSDSIESGVGKLVDADMEEESSKLSALQTQQQLAVQSLSIANSSSQSILSLFR